MEQFWHFFQLGFRHILNVYHYEHVLFLIALVVPFAFKDWLRLMLLSFIFVLGHTMALVLCVLGIITVKTNFVDLLVPVTILTIAVCNFFTAGKSQKKENISFVFIICMFYGILHGLHYTNTFNKILYNTKKIWLPISEISLGMEAAQLLVIFILLVLSYIVQTVFRFSKRDWTLTLSAFIIGVVLPLIVQHKIWLR